MNLIHLLPKYLATPLDTNPLPNADVSQTLPTILGIVFGIVGALAVLYVTLSGFRYITSAGDPQKIAKAKNGILYALIGVVVAVLAEAIVVYVGSNL